MNKASAWLCPLPDARGATREAAPNIEIKLLRQTSKLLAYTPPDNVWPLGPVKTDPLEPPMANRPYVTHPVKSNKHTKPN